MKNYVRTENTGLGFQRVTAVDDAGNYHQQTVWFDGAVSGDYKTTIFAMGWKSVRDFLRHRIGFVKEVP